MARVLIGPQSSQFKIIFNATHLGGIQGDMALDDLLFFNCNSCRGGNIEGVSNVNFFFLTALKLKPCTSKQFKCKTSGFCIDLDRLCDLTNDCFDGSDETLCTSKRSFFKPDLNTKSFL